MKCGLFAVWLPVIFSFPFVVFAQNDPEDSILYQQALQHTRDVYTKQIGDQSRLYNGSSYTGYGFSFKEGSPYFESPNFRNGSVIYDGIEYADVPLLFDDLRQKLITRDRDFNLQLISERISAFSMTGHHFIRFIADSLSKGPVKTGFYEVLYSGKSAILKHVYKTIDEDPTIQEGILRSVLETTSYFIKTGTGYSKVNSKRELLDVLQDHKKEMQRFIRKNRLKFRKDKDHILVQAAAYYDQLKG